MNDMTKQQTPAMLIDEYIRLRDEKKRYESEFEEGIRLSYTGPMEAIEKTILSLLNNMGVDSVSSSTVTAYKNTVRSITIEDKPAFRRHVIGSEAWDLADWRANKTMITDMINSGEGLPPGIKHDAILRVGFRKKS